MNLDAALNSLLSNPVVLFVWGLAVAGSLGTVVWHIRTRNSGISPLMKVVWGLTVLYSGPLGLAIYWYAGRRQIPEDTLWRRGFRSVAHCYSGCGAGEIIGITIAAGLLGLSEIAVIAVTFGCAYLLGYGLTVGPLLQEGVDLSEAVRDALYSETPSITVMEIVAIGTDRWLAASAQITDVLFWSALLFSLTIGLLAAYPVNVFLVREGVKEGMENPAQTVS